jgi:hypothetical protein
MSETECAVIKAVLYALKEGCFHPVPEPKSGASLRQWIQWGAMRNLHNALAVYGREVDAGRTVDAVGRRIESRPDDHAR